MYSRKNAVLPEKKPIISVVIAVYNIVDEERHEAFNRCLNSIRRQWLNDEVEITVADYGSDDGTIGVMRKFQQLEIIDAVYPSPYNDIYYAMNAAAEDFTCGKYITFIHFNDYYHEPSAFCDFIKKMLDANLDFISYGSRFYSTKSNNIDLRKDYEKENLIWRYAECSQGLFVDREVFLREKFDLRYLWGQDYEFMLRMGLKGYHLGSLDKPYKSVDFERVLAIASEAEKNNETEHEHSLEQTTAQSG